MDRREPSPYLGRTALLKLLGPAPKPSKVLIALPGERQHDGGERADEAHDERGQEVPQTVDRDDHGRPGDGEDGRCKQQPGGESRRAGGVGHVVEARAAAGRQVLGAEDSAGRPAPWLSPALSG